MTEENKKWSWLLAFCRKKKLDPTVKSNWQKAETVFTRLMGKGKIKYDDENKSR